MFPIERYLQPEEADPELIELYLKALLNRTVRPKWCPVMYIVAVHHVNRFMYLQDGKHKKLKKTILVQTLMIKHQVSIEPLSYQYFIILAGQYKISKFMVEVSNQGRSLIMHYLNWNILRVLISMMVYFQDLRKHLLFYKQAHLDCDCGLELYVKLPNSRQKATDQAS